jgi:amino acid permease
MQQGSVRGSIFALCAVAIGSGVLSLPYVLATNGWLLGTLLILTGALTGCLSMYMIVNRSILTGSKNFSQLALLAGGKNLSLFLNICILAFLMGACVSYQIISKKKVIHIYLNIVTKMFVRTCNDFGIDSSITGESEGGIS